MQSLWEWPGADQVTIAGQWLPAGKYLLQLALDPASSQCEVGQHGSIPFDVFWKLQLLPTADAKVCPIVPDDSKQKFSQVRLPTELRPAASSLHTSQSSRRCQNNRCSAPGS